MSDDTIRSWSIIDMENGKLLFVEMPPELADQYAEAHGTIEDLRDYYGLNGTLELAFSTLTDDSVLNNLPGWFDESSEWELLDTPPGKRKQTARAK